MNILDLFKWKTWLIILLVVIGIMWVLLGGRKYEVIGLSPFLLPTFHPQNQTIPLPEPNANKPSRAKKSVGEQITFTELQELFPGYEIIQGCRPQFLTNPETGRALELDCYLPELGIAVEYNGRQHYEFPNSFHSDQSEFEDQIYRDNLKRQLCDENEIYLITIPYHIDMCSVKNDGSQVCQKSVARNLRQQRIRNHLRSELKSYIQTVALPTIY
jgi:hypothetical protein